MRTIFRQPDDYQTFNFGDRIRQLQKIDPVEYDFEDIRASMSDWLLFMEGPEHLVWKKRLMQGPNSILWKMFASRLSAG
jgi:hypothetical protein